MRRFHFAMPFIETLFIERHYRDHFDLRKWQSATSSDMSRLIGEQERGERIIERSNLTRIMYLSGKGHDTRIARMRGKTIWRRRRAEHRLRRTTSGCNKLRTQRGASRSRHYRQQERKTRRDKHPRSGFYPPEGSFDGGRINVKRETTQIKSSKRKRDRCNYIVDTLCLSLLRALFHKKESFSQKIPISLFCRTVLNLIARLLLFAGD